ncbi:MAG TPA: choice-of-anchor D domain-containing protein, partial [Candidatus Hydrogenedentes bacterium]|nr:choice-of-anchor D domain-containing protein [Candidatus Hydrogenedentota bacterium]
DAWHQSAIRLTGLPTYRANLSEYDEIWFFAKADQPGKTLDFSVYAYPSTSNVVNIDPYIQGGSLDTAYRLVRIPISALKTATYSLEKVEYLYFGVAKPTSGHKLYIDDVWAVSFAETDPATTPVVGALPKTDFGDVPVKSPVQINLPVSNVGAASLQVSSVSIAGVNASDFSAPVTPFTVAPGATHNVSVTFTPASPGLKSASFVLTHNRSVNGVTTVAPLSGTGTGSTLSLSANTIDFGTVAVGQSMQWRLSATNTGNQDLVLSSIVASSEIFASSLASVTIPAGGSQSLDVTFAPTSSGDASGSLHMHSNDPNNPEIVVSLLGKGVEAGDSSAGLTVRTGGVTSSSVDLTWGRLLGGEETRVYIGAEPPAVRGAALPDSLLLASFPASTTSYRIEKLAAAVDVFIRVETISGGNVLAAGNAHVRTVGGQVADLNSQVRQVHLYAPNILLLVMADMNVHSFSDRTDTFDKGDNQLRGFTGPELQAGPWTVVRRDGTSLQVAQVHRESLPCGQPYYDVGYGTDTKDHLMDVNHYIYLVLNQPVGNREVLHVTGPLSADVYIPVSDNYLETPVLQVNQVGYSPRSTKRYAYVSGWMGDGGPLSLAGFPATADVLIESDDPIAPRSRVVSDLPISLRSANDTDAGTEVRDIDLSSVPAAEGRMYRVRIPGVGVSWPTQVSEIAVFKAYYTIVRGLFYNRWGRDQQAQYTDWSVRPPDHPTVYTCDNVEWWLERKNFSETTPKIGERPLSGGHHDAGDYDLRHLHYMVSMSLMRAFEINATAFVDGQLTIPESGNGIPDLLDEALYSIKAWEQLQEEDGGVRMGAESYRHPYGIYFADEDPLPYWTYARDPIHTARVAALF